MKIYYISLRWKIIHTLWSVVTAGLILGAFSYFLKFFLIMYIIFGAIFLVAGIYTLSHTKIIITEKGIEYHVPLAFAYEVLWGNIDEVGYYWFREGLFADRNSININYVSRNIYATFMGYRQSVFIPLSSFSNNWRDSELGQRIKQYAPRLFEEENKKSV